ncbi:hypothetical protein R8871_06501 [Paraburkholderia graminis C4D1M]|uniref:Uncharacterized protein n=1 Tax=Paraburkholderia graminis (strain ATCC 700544 / DSM 17151 / LMG 18924 / NCIMB 13744 / C4D1M) TaxID=396598 RepID=B1GB23_PARG4|nr:DUF5677 domain-containing protein [Paraburkholderia graminis]EDT06663.1 hypothetical protein BgramDRAFT_6560 [Paraburkholderia graminis C4D1M]CAB3739485.1 hypothetical protein R8871_06501 [Paraburkholderia graminis C4D1M]
MTTKHITAFRKAFKIDKTLNLSEAAPLIEAIYDAQSEAYTAVWGIDWDTPAVGFRAQTLFNLLSRTYEHVQAMLVASVTGSPASSEVLGRTVIEGAINVTYLAARGNPGMLLNFLHSWVSEHNKKLIDWRQLIADRAPPDVLDRIDVRQSLLGPLTKYLEGAETHCGLTAERSSSPWPKQLLQRFQALDCEDAYFECYHRLSGACHLTGEDTINYLIAQAMSRDVQVRMAREAWAYSRMMTMFSSLFFLDAADACAQAFGGTIPSLDAHHTRIVKEIVKIGPAAGVPNAA